MDEYWHDFYGMMVPAWDIGDGGDGGCCEKCGTEADELCPTDDGYYCEQCAEALVKVLAAEAEAFAHRHCQITYPPHEFDPLLEYRCSHEDYELGSNESYTKNAVGCHNRHNCTNYDELIKDLDRYSIRGRVYYRAIRTRIEQLIDEWRPGELAR